MRNEREVKDQIKKLDRYVVGLVDDTQFLMHHGWLCALNWVLEDSEEE